MNLPTKWASPFIRSALAGLLGMAFFGSVVFSAEPAEAATLSVTTCNDSGPGSLRQAVASAGAGDTVDFSLSCDLITLTTGSIDISGNVSIDGPGSRNLTVTAGGSTIFVDNGVGRISGLTMTGGTPAIADDGALTLSECTVTGAENSAIYENSFTASLTIDDCTLSHNSAYDGGAIYINEGSLTMTNSTVADNNVVNVGGGVFLGGSTPSLVGGQQPTATIIHSDIVGNTYTPTNPDTQGGGIGIYTIYGGVSVRSSIIADNEAVVRQGRQYGDCGGPIGGTYSLDDDGSCGFGGASLSDTPAGLDPSGLQNNGGPTDTVALEPGSLAIGAITDSSQCLPTDQRGYAVTTPCDIGAYDSLASPPANTPEAPYSLALPLLAFGLIGGTIWLRRRRYGAI